MIGERWADPTDIGDFGPEEEDGISPLDVKDLACPTWGLGKSLSAGTTVLTIGPPWLPLIIPPIEMFSLDPTWASACTGIFSGANGLTTFDLFDPPIALTPAAWLVSPTPTPVAAPANPTTTSEQITTSAKAAKPVSKDPTPPPVVASAEPVESIAPHDTSTASPGSQGAPPADPPSDPKIPLVVGDPPAGGPDEPSSKSFDPPPGDLLISPPNPNAPTAPVPQQAEKPQTPQGLGAIIYNAFGKPGPDNSPTNDDDNKVVDGSPVTQDTLTIAGQELVPDPSGMIIEGSSLLPGGSAVTISDTPISLGSSGILVVGSSTILLPTQLGPSFTPFATKAFTVAGQTFTPNPLAFPIAGTTLSAGGPAVTVSGTVISLGPSGALAIGSSTVALLPTYTVAGQTFTLLSSAVAIAGTTISAGGPAATIDGTIISVQPSGTLIVGSSTIPLLIPQSTFSSDVNIDGFDVELKPTFAVVDGVMVSPGAAGVTISGEVVSLEAGGKTLDVGTGRFALPPMRTGGANDSINVQAFTGGQSRGLRSSLSLLCGFYGTLVLLLT